MCYLLLFQLSIVLLWVVAIPDVALIANEVVEDIMRGGRKRVMVKLDFEKA